jgi:hypothetical protein
MDTLNAFQTEYGLLWIDNHLRLVQFDGAPEDAGIAWEQFCRHVLKLLEPPKPPKPSWIERLRRFLGGC